MNNFMNGYSPYGNYQSPTSMPNYSYGTSQYGVYNQQPTQQAQSFANEFKFMTEDEIKAYVVNPNCRLFGLDREKMKFFIKSTDTLGNSVIEQFGLVKDMPKQEQQPTLHTDELKNFVTKDMFSTELTKFKIEMDKKLDGVIDRNTKPKTSKE